MMIQFIKKLIHFLFFLKESFFLHLEDLLIRRIFGMFIILKIIMNI